MKRFKMQGWSFALVLASSPLIGCGDDKDGRKGDTAQPADTSDVADVDDVADAADTSTPTDATVAPDTSTPNDILAGGCSPEDLEACEYASHGLTYIERDGIATVEPETGRSLPLFVRLPAATGPLPVFIWSHGGGFTQGGQLNSDDWGDLVAKHGYVVIHVGHSPLEEGDPQKLCELASVPVGECVPTEDEEANGLLAIGRSYDLAAVLDDLPRLSQISVNNGGPALDLDRVAIGGWSGGSRGPMVLMGAKVKPSATAPLFTNPHGRPKAAIFASPAGPTFGGWFETADDNSWKELRGPTFTTTGMNDVKPTKTELTGAIRRRHFALLPADGKRWLLYSNLVVGVGGHSTYDLQDTGSADERLERLSRAIGSTARAFLDAHLDGDLAAKAWLASNNAKVLAGDVDWLTR